MLQRNKITQTLTLGAVQQLWFFNDLIDYGNNIIASKAAINAAVRIVVFFETQSTQRAQSFVIAPKGHKRGAIATRQSITGTTGKSG